MIEKLTKSLMMLFLYGIQPVELVCEDLILKTGRITGKSLPFTVERILIAPTWEEIPKIRPLSVPGDIIRIDPGMAFGTACMKPPDFVSEHFKIYKSR